MLKVSNLKLPVGFTEKELYDATAAALLTDAALLREITILRQAVDARRKDDVHLVLSVRVAAENEAALLGCRNNPNAAPYDEKTYDFSHPFRGGSRPVVVGSGPAGMFCALCLARAGAKPILLERGYDAETRARDVARFFRTGELRLNSNVQFGEGGAGTFSDGKLSTGTKDIRQRFVLEQYVSFGAPRDILTLAKPHIGTDKLRAVVQTMREALLSLGGDVLFGAQLVDISVKNNRLAGVMFTQDGARHSFATDQLVLAVGHSARDTFELLFERGMVLEQKAFAVGVRIEHAQQSINLAQYGGIADFKSLPAADYKLVYHAKNGRNAYTFCVCPGGTVVAAASEAQMVVTNGMSPHARNGANCNGALLVGVGPEDFPSAHPLAGIEYQRQLEREAFALGGGGYIAPAQLVGDFLVGKASTAFGGVSPTYLPGARPADLARCLPEYVTEALHEALPAFGKKIRGFDAADAVLTAVESRSSSPVRIPRGEDYQTNIRGVYACGEGAGYAGGILSSAVDGIKCAESLCISSPGG